MSSYKKLIITSCVLAITLVLAIAGIIIVLVSYFNQASSSVKVKYVADGVYVTLSATAYIGNDVTPFTVNGDQYGETELKLNSKNKEGSLSQPKDSLDLTEENNYAIFEYIFKNDTDNIDVKIELSSKPGDIDNGVIDNIDLSYAYSDTKITNFDIIEFDNEFNKTLLPAYVDELYTTKYIYIKAKISDLSANANLEGYFNWVLTRPEASEVNTIALSVNGADYLERDNNGMTTSTVTKDYVYKTFDTVVDVDDIDVYPAVNNKAFIGWSESNGGTVIESVNLPVSNNEHNALRGTSTAKTLYPVYKDGTVPADNYIFESGSYIITGDINTNVTEFIFPDIYNDSVNGLAKVTSIRENGYHDGLLDYNTTIVSVYYGRYLTSTGAFTFESCRTLTNVYLNDLCQSIDYSCFDGCSNITNIIISDSVTYIGEYALSGTKLTSIIIPSAVGEIYLGAFAGIDNQQERFIRDGKSAAVRNNCRDGMFKYSDVSAVGCRN